MGPILTLLSALALVGAVILAVHHAEVVAHRIGEPFGTLVLALSITVIEAALILSMMLGGGPGASALASIGLTIPVVVAASLLFDIPLVLGLDPKDLALLGLTFLVGTLSLATGRTNLMQGAVHLVVFAAFLFLALVP